MDEALRSLIEELRADYAQLQDTIRRRAAEAADSLIEEKIARINAAIDAKEEALSASVRDIETRWRATETALAELRLTTRHASSESDQVPLPEQFAREVRAAAAAVGQVAPAIDAQTYEQYAAAFRRYLRRGERQLLDDERRAMTVGSDPEGGYLVTPDLSGRIVRRVFDLSPVRQYASVQAISTDALEGTLDLDDIEAQWVTETSARPATATPKLGAWRIPVHELYAQPKATAKLLEDANIDVADWLAEKVASKFARAQNRAFLLGDGVGKPRGLLTYPTAAQPDETRTWGVFEHVAAGGASFPSDPDAVKRLLDLVHALREPYLPQAAWYMSRQTLGQVRQLRDDATGGSFVFIPSFQAAMPGTLLGYPVRVLPDMPSIAADALAIAFGDLSETYQVVDRLGIAVLVDPYSEKPYTLYYTRTRVGGDVINFHAMKLLKFAAA